MHGSSLCDRPAGAARGGNQRSVEPAGGPTPDRNLERGLAEGPGAELLVAEVTGLHPNDLGRAGDGNVPKALPVSGMSGLTDHPASRAPGLDRASNMEPALPSPENLSFHHPMVLEVEDRGGSIRVRQSKHGQGS